MATEDDLVKLVPNYSGGETGPSNSAYDWLQGFVRSGVESIPELIGITPSTDTLQWRQDHPVGGFVSEVAGMAVPYTGWFKATQKAKRFDKAINEIGDIINAPISTGIKREAARFAPFEAGRLAVSQVAGDQSFGSMLGDTAFNLAVGSGVGGVLHGFAAAGLRDKTLTSIFPQLDISLPLPLQARQMKDAIDSGMLSGEMLDRAQGKFLETLRAARTEELPSTSKYVGPIQHDFFPDSNTKQLESQLNRLFRVKDNPDDKIIQTRRFAESVEKDFPSETAWRAEAVSAGLPDGFERYGQFYRNIQFNKSSGSAEKVAANIDTRLTSNMESVGNGWFVTREADDGMFVLARKYSGEPGKASPDDKWVLFKTDQPGRFVSDADKWAKTVVAEHSWIPQAKVAADGGEVYNSLRNFTENFPLRNYMAMGSPSKAAEIAEKFIPKNIVGKDNELVQRLGETFREYLAPRLYQFKKSWRGNWTVNAAKVAYDAAETLANELMNGVVKVQAGKNLFFASLRNQKEGALGLQAVRDTVMSIPEDVFQSQWHKIWRDAVPVEQLAQLQAEGKILPEVRRMAEALSQVDAFTTSSINKAEEAVGRQTTKWMQGHYGLSRAWEGDTRILLQNDGNQTVAIASGPNRKAAQANAQALLRDNPNWHLGGEYSLSQMLQNLDKGMAIPDALKPLINSPSFLLERQGMRGFKWDTKPFTREEFLEAYEHGLRSRMRYQANLAVNDMLAPQLDRLVREDPAVFRMATSRLNDYAGVQSAFSKWQNQAVDAVLAPVIGTRGADKIVQVTNTALFNFQLGALKLAYPIVNALQFVQTVVPEAAFIMSAADDRLAGKYSYFAAGGSKGPVGGMGVLSPVKLMYESFKEMRAPSKELSAAFERAVNERVIDPRLVENYIGESATKVTDLRKLYKGEDIVGWLRALSEFLPAQTERLSRSHAFTVGHMIGRDFLKKEGKALDPDQIYQFAKQFTENTMYLYNASDKPRIFTTPAGSMMGLFKNWMFHFMGSMGEYTAEGFMKGNFSPLLWQTSGTFALGGLAATPMYWTADAFSRAFADKSVMQLAYEQFGTGGDAVMLGLPAAITGISLYSNVNTPLANPTRDASTMFSVVAWDRMKYIGKAAGAAFDHWQATGEHPARDRDVRALLARAFAPTTVYRTLGAMNEGQITSLNTGYPIVKEVPTSHRILYGFGFNPVELDRGMAVSEALYSNREKNRASVAKLGDAWADAQARGDSGQMALIMRQSMVWGLDVGSVIRSGLARQAKEQRDVIERGYKPQYIARYRAILQPGEQ